MTPAEVEFPILRAKYDTALRACVDEQFTRYNVIGILVSGTIIRGNPDAASDLDIHILHTGNFRERVQELHREVPCEIFVNPPSRIPRYFHEEVADRRPCTIHMFATGFVMYDVAGELAGLVQQAQKYLAQKPESDPRQLVADRYSAAMAFEDAEDLSDRDPKAALLLLGQAVHQLAVCRVKSEPGWLPRGKDLLAHLRRVDAETAALVEQAGSALTLRKRFDAARALCLRVTGSTGFLEWASEREQL